MSEDAIKAIGQEPKGIKPSYDDSFGKDFLADAEQRIKKMNVFDPAAGAYMACIPGNSSIFTQT